MHELGIVFHIIRSIEEIGQENQVNQVVSVTLELGEVSGVIPHYLMDCWKWAVKKHDVMQDAELRIETIKAETLCENCSAVYSTVEHGKRCPSCGSEQTYLLRGNEMNIKEIEAY